MATSTKRARRTLKSVRLPRLLSATRGAWRPREGAFVPMLRVTALKRFGRWPPRSGRGPVVDGQGRISAHDPQRYSDLPESSRASSRKRTWDLQFVEPAGTGACDTSPTRLWSASHYSFGAASDLAIVAACFVAEAIARPMASLVLSRDFQQVDHHPQ